MFGAGMSVKCRCCRVFVSPQSTDLGARSCGVVFFVFLVYLSVSRVLQGRSQLSELALSYITPQCSAVSSQEQVAWIIDASTGSWRGLYQSHTLYEESSAWICILMGCPLCPCVLSLRFHSRGRRRGDGEEERREVQRWRR